RPTGWQRPDQPARERESATLTGRMGRQELGSRRPILLCFGHSKPLRGTGPRKQTATAFSASHATARARTPRRHRPWQATGLANPAAKPRNSSDLLSRVLRAVAWFRAGSGRFGGSDSLVDPMHAGGGTLK